MEMLLKHKKGKSGVMGPMPLLPETFPMRCLSWETSTDRKRSVLQKHIDFKVEGPQTFQVHHRPSGGYRAWHWGDPCSRTALPPLLRVRQEGLGDSREHEILGSCSMPCAREVSRISVSVSILQLVQIQETHPKGSHELGASCSYRKAKKWLEDGIAEQPHSFWDVLLILFLCKLISNRKYQ